MKRELTYLITILMAITMVLACGDGSGGKKKPPGLGPQGEALGVICADLVQIPGEPCDAVLMSKPGRSASTFDIGNAPTAEFVAGDLIYNGFVYTQVEVDNYTPSFQRFYVYIDESHVKGCEYLNGSIQSYPFEINPMITKDFGFIGVNYGICAAMNQEDSYLTVTLYNASHLADDEKGDINIDGVLFNTTIYFQLVNSPASP